MFFLPSRSILPVQKQITFYHSRTVNVCASPGSGIGGSPHFTGNSGRTVIRDLLTIDLHPLSAH